MTNSVFYIQIGEKSEIGFGHPFGDLPGWQVFDLDNHCDQVTLQYTKKVLDGCGRVVLVFHQRGQRFTLGTLTALVEPLLRQKEKSIEVYTLGSASLPLLLAKKLSAAMSSADEVRTALNR